VINLSIILVLAAFWYLDYQREHKLQISEQAQRLREEAKVLRVAQQQLEHVTKFQQYVDAYCRQMERHISPGHHIIVTKPEGKIVIRAHSRADVDLEKEMTTISKNGTRKYVLQGEKHLAVGIPGINNTTIVVTQSLKPVQRVIQRQTFSRAASAGVLCVLLLIIVNILLLRWVKRPINRLVQGVRAIGDGNFAHRLEERGSSEFFALAQGFNAMAGKLENAAQRRKQEMDKARRIHMGLLPAQDTKIPRSQWTAHYQPAEMIGGDYYDLIVSPEGRWLLVVADVTGHGVAAALVTAMVKALLRQAATQNIALPATVELLNTELESLSGPEHFVTFLAGLYDPESGALEYINCGHESGIVLNSTGKVAKKLESSGLPLGIRSEIGHTVQKTKLKPGDRLFLFTDGIVELPGQHEEMLGRENWRKMASNINTDSPQQAVCQLFAQLIQYHGGKTFPDDATLLTLWRNK
jgi:serine phosphatase RsbU (regulator of sigma subunit)